MALRFPRMRSRSITDFRHEAVTVRVSTARRRGASDPARRFCEHGDDNRHVQFL